MALISKGNWKKWLCTKVANKKSYLKGKGIKGGSKRGQNIEKTEKMGPLQN